MRGAARRAPCYHIAASGRVDERHMILIVSIFVAAAIMLFVAYLLTDPVQLSYIEGASDWWADRYYRGGALPWPQADAVAEATEWRAWGGAARMH